MKYLGIDYGTKKIGLATSDDMGTLAFPNSILQNSGDIEEVAKRIKEFCVENNVDQIVIGESKDFNMDDNKIMEDVKSLKEFLEKDGLKVELHSELMTSHQVSKETFEAVNKEKNRKENKKDEMLDAKSATIMLQSFLDLNNK